VDRGAKKAEGAEERAEIAEQRDVFRKKEVGAQQEFERLFGVATIPREQTEPVERAGMAGLGAEDGPAKGFGFRVALLRVERGSFVKLGGGVHGVGSYAR
jgi:hypothetical protein